MLFRLEGGFGAPEGASRACSKDRTAVHVAISRPRSALARERAHGHAGCPTWEPDARLLAATTVVWPEHYSWPPQASRVEPIRLGLEPLARVARRAALFDGVPEGVNGVVPFLLEVGDRRLSVAIDYGYDTALDSSLLTAYDLIFKMQYLVDGYGSERVVPGGFISGALSLYRYLPHVRALRDRARPSVDAYGRFGNDKAIEIRSEAVQLLTEQQAFRYQGGFGLTRYAESLAEAARARVCIDLPGLGPLCFRLIDYLATGAAITSVPHACRLHVPLEEGRHVVYCKPDLSDLVDVIDGLRRDPARAGRISREARAYFDRYLDYRQLARYYLATCFDRL